MRLYESNGFWYVYSNRVYDYVMPDYACVFVGGEAEARAFMVRSEKLRRGK